MKTNIWTAALAGLIGLSMTGSALAADAKAAPAKAAPAKAAPKPAAKSATGFPRIGGHPDFSGVWSAVNRANWNIEPHAASAAIKMRPGPLGPVPDKDVLRLGATGSVPEGLGIVDGGLIPYKPEALKVRDANKANTLERDPEVKCYLPGVPRANYMDHPFEIFQSDNSMLISYEYAAAVRNLLFKDPGPAPTDSWMGQSVAKWEGDTLVVTVTGMLDRTWFDRAGNFHSDQMKVVERWTPMDATHVRYEAEITDPETFTRPWKMHFVLYKHVADDDRLLQFKCVEFVEELLFGTLRKNPLPR
jgi:hypothetical protein